MSTLAQSAYHKESTSEGSLNFNCKSYPRQLYEDWPYIFQKSLSFSPKKFRCKSFCCGCTTYKLEEHLLILNVSSHEDDSRLFFDYSQDKKASFRNPGLKRPNSVGYKGFKLIKNGNSHSSKQPIQAKMTNQGVDHELWIDALNRAELYEYKQESLVSNIFSLSNLDDSSFKQRSIVMRENSKPSVKEQLNDSYFFDIIDESPKTEEFNNMLKDLNDLKRIDLVESMILNSIAETMFPVLKEIAQLRKVTTSSYLNYFKNNVADTITEFSGCLIMQLMLFRFSQEAISLLYHEVI